MRIRHGLGISDVCLIINIRYMVVDIHTSRTFDTLDTVPSDTLKVKYLGQKDRPLSTSWRLICRTLDPKWNSASARKAFPRSDLFCVTTPFDLQLHTHSHHSYYCQTGLLQTPTGPSTEGKASRRLAFHSVPDSALRMYSICRLVVGFMRRSCRTRAIPQSTLA